MNTKHKQQDELENLFQFASPSQLRQSVTHVFFSYLTNTKTDFPKNFDQIAEDFYFLIDFLQEVEKGIKEVEEGKVVSLEEAKNRLNNKWSK